ncbi:Sterol-sensing domain and Patched family-containing protein [Aphelenchoides bicaudatus]|nr:Sterol-sensing domain and Patched family-containing protein [Aphelenchoides bicaudatus]
MRIKPFDQVSNDVQPQGFLMRHMNKFFELLGIFVTKHPLKIIAFCSVLTAICFVKTATTKKESDLLAYAPPNARSRHEFAVYQEFFGHNGQGIMNYVLIQAKDNGSMIRVPHLNETVRVLDNIGKNFKNGLFIQDTQLNNEAPLNGRIHLKYPITSMFNRKFSIQASFFGVEVFSDLELEALNSNRIVTNIKTAQMIVLQFRAEKDESWAEDAVLKYEQSIANFYMNEYNNDLIDVLVINLSYVSQEIERNGLALQPLLIVGFLVALAITACVVPLMACVTAFGIAFFCGLRFSPVIMVTPFLVLAIGVDDSFLMTFTLHNVSKKHSSIEERISKVCAETGPSVCLSSITNILAFLIGSLSATPEIQLFSIVNAIALTFDLIYSLTLYAAILTIYGRNEAPTTKLTNSSWQLHLYKKVDSFVDSYVRFLSNIWVLILVPILLILFGTINLNGALRIDVDLNSEKFFLKDSKLLKADTLKQNYVTPVFTALVVIVNNPGNLSDTNRLRKLESLVNHLEQLVCQNAYDFPSAIGKDSTKFFLYDYMDYIMSFVEMDDEQAGKFDVDNIEHFLSWPEYSYWNGFLQISNDTKRPGHKQLDKFFFTTGYNGELLKQWSKRHEILNEWRTAVDAFGDFNASIYYDDSLFLDLINVLPSSTLQSVLATLASMVVVCYLFISDSFTVFITSLSIFSICLNEFGLLYYCGLTLDPISMACLVMTIGFSVDLPSHVAYHFYKTEFDSGCGSVEERLKSTLACVGYPVIQAGLSTILCLITLLLAPLYMSQVFVLCMGICITLSILHALFVLPCIFIIKSKLTQKFKNKAITSHTLSLSTDKY